VDAVNRVKSKIFRSLIANLHKAIEDYQKGLVRIDREFNTLKKELSLEQERNREIRKSNWKAGFAKEWERNAAAIARVSSQLRRHQPALRRFWR
jgi:S-DNA-T family DNA segregation ATPase FtsK/SpoIIIE